MEINSGLREEIPSRRASKPGGGTIEGLDVSDPEFKWEVVKNRGRIRVEGGSRETSGVG